MFAFYLNVFVAVVQAPGKIDVLHKLVPNGSEPPFAVAQGIALLALLALGFFIPRRFRPA